MPVNRTIITVAAGSSLATLCATVAVIALATDAFHKSELSDAQRTEIASIVKDELRAGRQAFSNAQRQEIARIARDHLRSNPEVMQEILAEMIKRRMASAPPRTPAAPDRSEQIRTNVQALFHSSHQAILGNRQGDAILVEFFDYNCGYCRRALADKLALLKDDPRLKIVLKEHPILGPASLEAAKVSIAVRMQDPDGEKYREFHHKLLSVSGRANKANALALAESIGLDAARLERDMESDEVTATISESRKLAQALGITGTPAYVTGNKVVPGAVGYTALSNAIKEARN